MTNYIPTLRQLFPKLDKNEQVRLLCELTSFVSQASISNLHVNMLDNYNHRTIQVYDCVSQHNCVNNLVMNPKRTGKDAWCDRFRNMEIKTSKGKYPTFLFDKQNNELRRQQFFDYDAFAFATFQNECMTRCMFVYEPESIWVFRDLFTKKQYEFIEKDKQYKVNGKRGYDTIAITLKDIQQVKHDLYIPGDGWKTIST
jgi:hypothetical protein